MSSSDSRIPEGFSINQVVPWGRGAEEYRRFFALSDADLKGRLLDCAGGPSDFTAEMNRLGYCVTAVDPLYAFSREEIERRIRETRPMVMDLAEKNQAAFLWNEIESVEELGRLRMTTMARFLDDLAPGLAGGRYLPEALPHLSAPDQSYDLALCSHYLFLYSDQVDLETHWSAICELMRVAKEVRIFPLISLRGVRSVHLDEVLRRGEECGWELEVARVPYEFQRNGNEMLRLRRGGD